MSKEIEIKFRVDDVRSLARRLRGAGFRQVTRRTHESNTLYDLPGLRLRKRGELLRLRKYGASWLLTHKAKGKVARHKTRIETRNQNRKWRATPKDPAGTGLPAFLPLREVPRGVERRQGPRGARRNSHRLLRRDRRPGALD